MGGGAESAHNRAHQVNPVSHIPERKQGKELPQPGIDRVPRGMSQTEQVRDRGQFVAVRAQV